MLAARFPFPREARITFNEEKHEYTIDGIRAPRSATGLLNEYKPGFDATAYWARTGLMDLVRTPDGEPTLPAAGMGDHPSAMSLLSRGWVGFN